MRYLPILLAALLLASCQKDGTVTYEVEKQAVYQHANEKQNVKTALEFVSIAYSDIFGTLIQSQELEVLIVPYQATGDKQAMEDIIIRSALNQPAAIIPTDAEMRADVDAFVLETYLRFYNRKPNEYETWQLREAIEDDSAITPEMIYYAVLTSNEYRHY